MCRPFSSYLDYHICILSTFSVFINTLTHTHTHTHTHTPHVPLMFPYACVLAWSLCKSFSSAHHPCHSTPSSHPRSPWQRGLPPSSDDSARCGCDWRGNSLSVVAVDTRLNGITRCVIITRCTERSYVWKHCSMRVSLEMSSRLSSWHKIVGDSLTDVVIMYTGLVLMHLRLTLFPWYLPGRTTVW